jgi:hypothetical protein
MWQCLGSHLAELGTAPKTKGEGRLRVLSWHSRAPGRAVGGRRRQGVGVSGRLAG